MIKAGWTAVAAAALLAVTVGTVGQGKAADPDAPRFTAKGDLVFPADYRSWTFVTSGHGMSYNEKANAAADLPFDNVFAQPAAYRAFVATGHWPEGTVLVLEVRGSTSHGSINKHGAYQSGDPVGIEIHVRDSKRFKGGWGFFGADLAKPTAAMIGYEASCYACHQAHGAVDTTFVQFYPTLLPVAKAKATFSAAYLSENPKP